MRSINLKYKILTGVVAIVVLNGLAAIILIPATLSDKIEKEFQKTAVYLTKDTAADSINPILNEQFLDLNLLLLSHKEAMEDMEYIYIVNEYNEVIAHTFADQFPADLLEVNIVGFDQEYSVQHLKTERGLLLDIAVPIWKGSMGVIHVGMSEEPISKSIKSITRLIIWIIMVFLVIGGGIALLLARMMTMPVYELKKGADAIGSGDLEHKVKVGTKDEIGQLADSFNTMTANLRTAKEKLEESNERFRIELLERAKVEAALLDEKQRLEEVTGYANCGLFLLDDKLRVTYANRVAESWFGPLDQIKGTCCWELFKHQDSENECSGRKVLNTGETSRSETYMEMNSGEKKYFYEVASPVKNKKGDIFQINIVVMDITGRKMMEDRIRASLDEKEVLLREIHHRVKNNFQLITSLFSIQAQYVQDERLQEVFKDIGNRISSMSMVHEKLYQSGDLSNVDSVDFIKSLTIGMLHSYSDAPGVSLETDIEPVKLSVDSAIPCGLVISELVSNSFKHAFPKKAEGVIRVYLNMIRPSEGDEYDCELRVSDNGIGIPEDVINKKSESMGLNLVTILVERQLLGKMEISRDNGTEFKIKFNLRRKIKNKKKP